MSHEHLPNCGRKAQTLDPSGGGVVVQTLHLSCGKLCLQDGAHRKRAVFIVRDYKDSHVCLAADHAAVNKSFLRVTTQKVWPTAINFTGERGKTKPGIVILG